MRRLTYNALSRPRFYSLPRHRGKEESGCCCRQDLRPELILVSSHLCNLRNLWISRI